VQDELSSQNEGRPDRKQDPRIAHAHRHVIHTAALASCAFKSVETESRISK
jgi:hypothetical protein